MPLDCNEMSLENRPLSTEGYQIPTDNKKMAPPITELNVNSISLDCESQSTLCTEPQDDFESILCMEYLPESDCLDFPRDWLVPLLPDSKNSVESYELYALSTEIVTLKDRVTNLESELRHLSTDRNRAVTEKSTRYVSAMIINIESDHLNGTEPDSRMNSDDYTDTENSELNESIEQSSDTMEDSHLNESVEPSPVYGTETTESSEGNESVKQSTHTPMLRDNNEAPVSDTSGNSSNIDLNSLFGESSSQMENENKNDSRDGSERINSLKLESEPTTEKSTKCALCQGTHSIWKCEIFKSYNLDSRWKKAKELGLCFRCLGVRHKASSCKKTKICGINKCRLSHATLLHDENRRKMLRESKAKQRGERDVCPPAASGADDEPPEQCYPPGGENNLLGEPPDLIEPSGGDNGEIFSSFETLAPSIGTDEDKQVTDLCHWLMPIPTVDPGGS